MVSDIGYFYLTKNQLQGAAYASTLAGAAALPDETTARAEAVKYALMNIAVGTAVQVSNDGSNVLSSLSINTGNDLTVGFWNTSTGIYSAGSTTINAVQVRARMTVGSPGGGVNSLIFRSVVTGISATAIATAATSTLTKV